MKNYFENYPLAKTGLLGIPLIIFIIVMGFFFPQETPDGFGSFIIAFEFAKTPADITLLFSSLTREEIWKIDVGNYIDYGFMLAYSILLAVTFRNYSKLLNKKFLKAGIFIAIIVFLSDFAENIFLLKLTDNYLNLSSESEIIINLQYLNIFTWSKWISLSLIFTLFYSVFYKEKWYIKIPGVIFLFPLLYLIASPERTPEMLTNFTNSISFCFAALTLFLFATTKKWIEKNRR